MIYNLSPILNLLTPERPNAAVWRERIQSFFTNEEYDSNLQDEYYDLLISVPAEIDYLFSKGVMADPYTGLFTIPASAIEFSHTFNLANFINSQYQYFFGKNILTICNDFGIVNIQAKLCGLNIVTTIQKEILNIGTALTCIGNNSPPYHINKTDFEKEDVIFMSCVFNNDDRAYQNWQFMLDKKLDGKEVFFSTDTFFYLKDHINYDRIECVVDPHKIYRPEDYANLSFGYSNKIYRLK